MAVAVSALLAAGGASEATAVNDDTRRAATDLAQRVASLRQVVTERQASADRNGEWVDRVLSPKIELSQEKKWNKWKNG
jgi:hypothetical protein